MFVLRSSRFAFAYKIKLMRLSFKFWIPFGEELTEILRCLAYSDSWKWPCVDVPNFLLYGIVFGGENGSPLYFIPAWVK